VHPTFHSLRKGGGEGPESEGLLGACQHKLETGLPTMLAARTGYGRQPSGAVVRIDCTAGAKQARVAVRARVQQEAAACVFVYNGLLSGARAALEMGGSDHGIAWYS
jgi:hypothetical protein